MSLEISPDLRKNVAARSISNKSLMPMFESSKYKYLFMQKWQASCTACEKDGPSLVG
jgi:hypothetical protein